MTTSFFNYELGIIGMRFIASFLGIQGIRGSCYNSTNLAYLLVFLGVHSHVESHGRATFSSIFNL